MDRTGEFSLIGSSGAFIPQRPTDRHPWGLFEGRGPHAVGKSPVLSGSAFPATDAAAPQDPALRVSVSLRPRPACSPAQDAGESAGTPPEPKVTCADVLEALHQATGLPGVADHYTRLYKLDSVSVKGQPLSSVLNHLASVMRLRWVKDAGTREAGGWLQFRSATYYHDRLKEVPNRLLARWAEARRKQGMLPLDDLVEIAQLSDEQLNGEEMREGAVECWGLKEWPLLLRRHFRGHVRFLAEFTPAQRQAMMSPAGLEFARMSLSQQQGFLSRALGDQPLRSLDELAGATLRVDYTQPGWFQWQQPGGFDVRRGAVRVEPGPAGRRLLMPPIRERTPGAALQAARRVFPPVTHELLQAVRESDPQMSAEQLIPQASQIHPTELDLVIVYVPGTKTERRIRWVRTRQDLEG